MTEWLKGLVLRTMRVPSEPHPPVGAEGSIRIFRASRRFYQLNLLRWGLRQTMALAGILFALAILGGIDFGQNPLEQITGSPRVEAEETGNELRELSEQLAGGEAFLRAGTILTLLHLLEILTLLFFVGQLPVTYMLVRLDYELRWYIVTDRSLRIREGIFRVNELTLTFANVQDVSIRQNPIQRLLGISDLRVQTAGGGGSSQRGPGRHRQEESGHIGYFHGLDDAEAIRDLILERLRLVRSAGLGDLDPTESEAAPQPASATPGLLAAAQEILAEAQALRQTERRFFDGRIEDPT